MVCTCSLLPGITVPALKDHRESSRFARPRPGFRRRSACNDLHDHARTCMNPQVNASTRQAALWDGRFHGPAADAALTLSGSLAIDLPLAEHDVAASRAHVGELARLGLI